MKNEIKEYSVYMHVFPNKKKYIGITRQEPNKRFGGGFNYQTQVVGRAIKKYGWENIEHKILYENLTKQEAIKYEQELIKKYKTNQKKFGYNKSIGGETGRKNNYMCEKAIMFIHNSYVKFYGKGIVEYWKFLCEDELEAKVFNQAYNYVDKHIPKKTKNYIYKGVLGDCIKAGAINTYLEAWRNNWTPYCAMYNTLYYIVNIDKMMMSRNDDWKKKIKIEERYYG